MSKIHAKCLAFALLAASVNASVWAQAGMPVPDPPQSDNVTLPQGSGDQFYIFFNPQSTKPTDEGLRTPSLYSVSTTLAMVLKLLRDNPSDRMIIEGFANPVTRTKNEPAELLRLSNLRAKEIENRFVRDGIARYRFITVGSGGIYNTDRSAVQQAKNRRVTMTVLRPDNANLYRINFEPEWASVTGAQLYAQPQIDSLKTILAVTSYIKENPHSRVLVLGYETPVESRVKRKTPINQQRANEVARLLNKEFALEGIRNYNLIVSASANVQEPAVEILILDSSEVPY